MASTNSFDAHGTLEVGEQSYEIYRLAAVEGSETLPYSLKVLAREPAAHRGRRQHHRRPHPRPSASWDANAEPDTEIQFTPARVIMQDFTGVPCIVDLATMREAVADLGGDPTKINPLAPAELVIDHSVIIDVFGRADAFERNVEIEYERNARALPVPALGPDRLRRLQGRPPGHRHRPPGQHRAPRPHRHGPRRRAPTPTPASAPTRTRRWSTASACSAGASAASRPRRPCSASPSRCSSRASSASS